jgi:hypothetical protein
MANAAVSSWKAFMGKLHTWMQRMPTDAEVDGVRVRMNQQLGQLDSAPGAAWKWLSHDLQVCQHPLKRG